MCKNLFFNFIALIETHVNLRKERSFFLKQNSKHNFFSHRLYSLHYSVWYFAGTILSWVLRAGQNTWRRSQPARKAAQQNKQKPLKRTFFNINWRFCGESLFRRFVHVQYCVQYSPTPWILNEIFNSFDKLKFFRCWC